jgi:hypothetical protein
MATKMVEINCETGQVVEREMTKDELSAEKKFQDDAKKVNPNDLTQTPEALEKEAQRQAILDRLGITAEEAQLLLA